MACPGRAVDGAVDAALPGGAQDFGDRFLRLEHHVGSHGARQLAAMRQRLDGPDAACVGSAQCGNGQQADRSCTDDRDGFARGDGRQTHGMQRDSERLGQSGCIERQRCRDGREVRDGQVDQLAEKAWVMRVR